MHIAAAMVSLEILGICLIKQIQGQNYLSQHYLLEERLVCVLVNLVLPNLLYLLH